MPRAREGLASTRGQASIEAAALLGALMLLLALLVQPVCMLYTKAAMSHAAAQTARIMATTNDDEVARSFAVRRLRAVPEASIFHEGGDDDWSIGLTRASDGRSVRVDIAGHVRLLPLFGIAASFAGEIDGTGVVLRVSRNVRTRSSWLEGEYDTWMQAW